MDRGCSPGNAPKPHQRHVHRNLRHLSQFEQFLRGAREHHAAADIENRLLGLRDGFSRLLDLPLIPFIHRIVAADGDGIRIGKFRLRHGHVFRNIHQHRPWAPRRRDIEGFFDRRRQIVHIFHEKIVFRAGTAQADIVCFLKRIVADQAGRNLSAETDQRHGIHIGIRQRRNHVGHAGSGGHQTHARLCRSPWHSLRPYGPRPAHGGSRSLQYLSVDGACRKSSERPRREAQKSVFTPSRLRHSMRISAPVSFMTEPPSIPPVRTGRGIRHNMIRCGSS